MDPDLSARVERYLHDKGDWVPAHELEMMFGIDERVLRAIGDQPGLCSRCAISGNRGYKHVTLATTSEWNEHYRRERRHNIMALVNLRARRKLRKSVIRSVLRPPLTFERDTGQAVMTAILH